MAAENVDVEEEEEATCFQFPIPDCAPDTVMKVTAPDGVQLHMKRPGNVLTGDQMVMSKQPDGKWGVQHVVRAEATTTMLVGGEGIAKRSQAELDGDLADTRIINKVRLETTKGPILIRVCPTWAPLGAQRFMQLCLDGFYTELAIYRAVPKFLVQFGVTNDAAAKARYQVIDDDMLCGVPVQDGMVCFAASGPNTRKSTICIFLDDIPQLGKNPWETPFGKVDPASMATLKALFTGYGDMPQCGGQGPDPIELEDRGATYIKEKFPKCDFITKATWVD